MKTLVGLEKRRSLVIRFAPFLTRKLRPTLFANVTCLCLFIGHGRSGSTLLGSILNAHPNVVMSNELDVIDLLQQGLTRDQLFNLIYYEARRHSRRGSPGGGGYTYSIPNQWQGKHRQIRVIGDRKAGSTAIQLYREPALLARLRATVAIPLVFVCVVRNPFDTVATTFRKTPPLAGELPREHLRRQIDRYFERWEAISNVHDAIGADSFFFVSHEDLVNNPHWTIRNLCNFLLLEPDNRYVSDCAGIIKSSPHRTRDSIEWSSELKEAINERCAAVPWLHEYSFD